MEYNTNRERLIIPEYGRHLQEMVNYCKTIEDKEERNDFAEAIIEVMGNVNPHLRDVQDFQHKLWDQLFIMADFELDVDPPYPTPTRESLKSKPNRIEYPSNNNKYRYYGKNIQRMIDVAKDWENSDEKAGLIKAIANQMKKSYLLWNKDTVDDQVIFNQLKEMSGGEIDISNMDEYINLASKRDLKIGGKSNNRNHKNYSKKRRSSRRK
ncbi:DUF4290 domain-containing protein [Flavobacteriaceae bacterium Ap0902]|nr:DUF4290 domain-containing protein [Flavobacteriaceae bacterium Ap0902]